MKTVYFNEPFDWHTDGLIYAFAAGFEIEVEDDAADAAIEAGAAYEVEAEDD